jgi:hypothetical protein
MPANKKGTGKRPVPKTAWKKGQSGNPKGRPKDGESWSAIIKAVGDMYPDDILTFIGKDNQLGRTIAQLPRNVQMKYQVVTRVFAALMFDPSSSLFKELMDRSEGKVPDHLKIDDMPVLVFGRKKDADNGTPDA